MENEFPFLKNDIIYLDTAASAQKPQAVLDATVDFYQNSYANVHRGIHTLAEKATNAYEDARNAVANFIGADSIIFTKGTTEAMNLLASTTTLTKDDIVILTELEHHATSVPWQQAAIKAGATLKFIPHTNGELDMEAAERIISQGCTILAVVHISNVTGTTQDLNKITKLVHDQGGKVVVDGAQAAPHISVNVKELNVDAYAFSAHKLYGPTGIGALYVQEEWLESLPPYQFGGEMIDIVEKESTTFANPPARFEAGTPPIVQAVGFHAAINWHNKNKHLLTFEEELVHYCYEQLRNLEGISIIGPVNRKALVSFTVENVHPHDVAEFLNQRNIAIRAGHHCTQILHKSLGLAASCRASFGMYNRKEDVDKLIEALKECQEAFRVS